MRPLSPVFRRACDGVLLVGLALGSVYASARIELEPRDPSQGVGVIFAPWTAADVAMKRAVEAGARFVRFGGVPFAVVVMPEEDGYLRRVKADGAWLVVDPQALAACASVFSVAQVQQ